MNITTYKRPVPRLKLIYGAGLIIIGSISTISGNAFGLIFLACGFYFFRYEGIEFDFENKTYRNIYGILNFKLGKWTDLPEIDYISVFKMTESSRVWVSTASTVVKNTIIHVNLFYNTNRKITAFETTDKTDAFRVAKELAMFLNTDILDATQSEPEWL